MKEIFDTDIQCTDPDQLQFCKKLSDTCFWYCTPNIYNDKMPNHILEKYLGYPLVLLQDAKNDSEIYSFVTNFQFWLEGEIDVNDFTQEEKEELLDDYGYKWDSFNSDAERNQIICENYFESYPIDFMN